MNPNEFDHPYPQTRIQPPPIITSPLSGHVMAYPRPKSSPSTFGPNVEDLLFPENPFRMRGDDGYPNPAYSISPVPLATKASSPFQYSAEYPASSNPSASPNNRSVPVPIAPDPIGLRQMNALKRMREDEEYSDFGQKKRKRASSQAGPVELNEEEQLLLRLKEEENLPWKDIAIRFQTELGKSYQVPALQMRFKRLRERMRSWTETDVRLPSSRGRPPRGGWSKPSTTGRNSNSTLLPQRYDDEDTPSCSRIRRLILRRCWTLEPPNAGRPSIVHGNGRRCTLDERPPSQTSLGTHGTPSAQWSLR